MQMLKHRTISLFLLLIFVPVPLFATDQSAWCFGDKEYCALIDRIFPLPPSNESLPDEILWHFVLRFHPGYTEKPARIEVRGFEDHAEISVMAATEDLWERFNSETMNNTENPQSVLESYLKSGSWSSEESQELSSEIDTLKDKFTFSLRGPFFSVDDDTYCVSFRSKGEWLRGCTGTVPKEFEKQVQSWIDKALSTGTTGTRSEQEPGQTLPTLLD